MPAGYPRAADEGNEIAGARRAECSYARRKCVVDGDGGWVEKGVGARAVRADVESKELRMGLSCEAASEQAAPLEQPLA